MNDPREELITITLQAQEWDSLGCSIWVHDAPIGERNRDGENRRYATSNARLNGRARTKIAEATPGAEERFEVARKEIEDQRPHPLDHLDEIEEAVTAFVEWFDKGDFEGVSHLGGGNPVFQTHGTVGGMYINMVPSGVLIFEMPERHFAGKQAYGFTQEEHDALLAICKKCSNVLDSWNGAPYHTMSVRFGYR